MNRPVFSRISKVNVTKSKYEVEWIGMEVFTSRSIQVRNLCYFFSIYHFSREKGITRRRQTGYQVRYLPEDIFKESVTILRAQHDGFAQRLKRCLYETVFVPIAPADAVHIA